MSRIRLILSWPPSWSRNRYGVNRRPGSAKTMDLMVERFQILQPIFHRAMGWRKQPDDLSFGNSFSCRLSRSVSPRSTDQYRQPRCRFRFVEHSYSATSRDACRNELSEIGAKNRPACCSPANAPGRGTSGRRRPNTPCFVCLSPAICRISSRLHGLHGPVACHIRAPGLARDRPPASKEAATS